MTNICIFGAGRIGRLHAANVDANPRSRLAAIADANPEAASALSGKYGCTAYADPYEALGDPDIDAVIIGVAGKGGVLRETD